MVAVGSPNDFEDELVLFRVKQVKRARVPAADFDDEVEHLVEEIVQLGVAGDLVRAGENVVELCCFVVWRFGLACFCHEISPSLIFILLPLASHLPRFQLAISYYDTSFLHLLPTNSCKATIHSVIAYKLTYIPVCRSKIAVVLRF